MSTCITSDLTFWKKVWECSLVIFSSKKSHCQIQAIGLKMLTSNTQEWKDNKASFKLSISVSARSWCWRNCTSLGFSKDTKPVLSILQIASHKQSAQCQEPSKWQSVSSHNWSPKTCSRHLLWSSMECRLWGCAWIILWSNYYKRNINTVIKSERHLRCSNMLI